MSIADNARRLGEVADWVRRTMNYHNRPGALRQFGFHINRHCAKPLVI